MPEFDCPTCHNCGEPLGVEWRVRNMQATMRREQPAHCSICGKNPLPPVGEYRDMSGESDSSAGPIYWREI